MLKDESPSHVGPAGLLCEAIDVSLNAYTDLPSDCPGPLREAIRYSLLSPGKRLRPRLVLMAAEACGAAVTAALPAACAVEMIHAYSLVHDDLPAMDDDALRRGRPTCHRAFGEALAILAGDALLTLAFEVMATEIEPPATAARCCAELARAAGATALVGGQADDLEGTAGLCDLPQLERIHRRKTGAMFRVALRLGAIVADASPTELEALDQYGTHLGLAFQITDDLLDVAGDPCTVGKQVGKDADRGRLSYPGMMGVEASRTRVAALVDQACAAVAALGSKGAELTALARATVLRDR
jgi:geranylgeranyl diphosphate synthase type II